jgi:hypothetical protein
LHLHDGYQLITNATTGTSTGLLVGLDTGDAVISNQYAGALKFGTSNGEKARIDSSGRFLVGTSSALTNIKRYAQSIAPTQQIISNDTANWNTGLGLINYSASGYAPVLTLGLSASNTAGTNTLVSADHRCGVITFNGNDGTDFEEAARIEAFVDGTPGANDMPGRLVFSTTADGASSPTERMRITNGGYTKISNSGNYIGSTASYHEICQNANQTILWLRNSESTLSQTSNGLLITYNNAAPNGLGAYFVFCEDSVGQRFGVRSNGGVVNYSGNNVNLCDRNSKKDIAPAAGTWDCLKEWEIVNFRYKDQSDDADLNMGVIAQQIAESCPEVITVFQEATEATEDAPAKEERLGVKDQQMMWMAIKALQEAQLRIEQLEAKVAALEAS